MNKFIPKILLYSRLVFAFILLLLTVYQPNYVRFIVLLLLYLGVISDIFDGIIARKLNISTDNFRVLDTIFDMLFFFSILIFIYSVDQKSLYENRYLISIIFSLEMLMYLFSLIKFKILPSPHSILSKFWGLYMVIEFTLLIVGVKGNHFTIALIYGIVVHFDRFLIYLLLKKWDHDIPSSYHAFLLRQGKTITRNKIFNG